MDEMPADILERIADDARPVVLRWWAGLGEADRRDAVAAWDEAGQAAFFAPEPGTGREPPPVVIGGRFVPAEHPLVGPEWHADYFEYLLKYPELLLCAEPHVRVGGVCTAHPAARAALAAGCVPAGFACPVGSAECPMRRLLAVSPNRSLKLVPTGCPIPGLRHFPDGRGGRAE